MGLTTRVWAYAAKTPTSGLDGLQTQLWLAHNYYNALIAIERARREAFRACCARQPALQEIALQIEACEGLLADARHQAGNERMEARSRKGASDETRARCKQSIEDLSAWLRPEWKAGVSAERRSNSTFAAALKAVDKHAYKQIKETRRAYGPKGKGLGFGSYLASEAAAEQARVSHRPPQFRHWDGTGQVAVQLQNGRALEDVFTADPAAWVGIAPLPPTMPGYRTARYDHAAYTTWQETHTSKGAQRRTTARLRLAADVWVTLPLTLHRMPPPGARLKWARIRITRVAAHTTYAVQLTFSVPAPPLQTPARGNAVGIDLGWRWQDQIRVAYAFDSTAQHQILSIPNEIPRALQKADELRAIRGRGFNTALTRLRTWLSQHVVPEWLTEATETLSHWRAAGRLAALAIKWRAQRFEGDRKGFAPLELWRKQDKHLWEWETNARRKALARRLDLFRNWAAAIATNYTLVCIEQFDLRKLARKPAIEQEGEYDDLARKQRIVSAPGLLRQTLLQACAARGTLVVYVPCAYTTVRCHACARLTPWDAARYLSHRCTHCGAVWDQDHNAAVQILRIGLASAPEAWRQAENQVAEPKLSSWQQAKLAKLKRAAAASAAVPPA